MPTKRPTKTPLGKIYYRVFSQFVYGFDQKQADRIWTHMGAKTRGTNEAAARAFLHLVTEETSPRVASKAGKLLRDPKAGKAARSVAASALTQTKNRRKA